MSRLPPFPSAFALTHKQPTAICVLMHMWSRRCVTVKSKIGYLNCLTQALQDRNTQQEAVDILTIFSQFLSSCVPFAQSYLQHSVSHTLMNSQHHAQPSVATSRRQTSPPATARKQIVPIIQNPIAVALFSMVFYTFVYNFSIYIYILFFFHYFFPSYFYYDDIYFSQQQNVIKSVPECFDLRKLIDSLCKCYSLYGSNPIFEVFKALPMYVFLNKFINLCTIN